MAIENMCKHSEEVKPKLLGMYGEYLNVVKHECTTPDRPKSELSGVCAHPSKQSKCPWFIEKQQKGNVVFEIKPQLNPSP